MNWMQIMKSKYCLALSFAFFPMIAFSTDSLYCPAKQGYVSIGMSSSQVSDLCGQPMSKQDSIEIQVARKIPVTQLIYTNLNQGSVYSGLTSYYTMWSLPSGSNGTSLRVNVVDNKVTGVDINGSDTNAMSICGGISVQIGDDVNKVYSACGNPSLVNETFINQKIPKSERPEVWIYQLAPYQPTIRLTFIDGKLQSIQ